MSDNKTTVLEGKGYPIFIGDVLSELNNWLKEKKYSALFVVTDINVYDHCLPIIRQNVPSLAKAAVIPLFDGELYKKIVSIELIWQFLLEHEADKKSLLINLGGGAITDMGGFAAATYKRGIDFINVPTSLLGMVDAAIGGKTGVDFNDIKNAIGIIKNPEAVFIHPAFLQTLPQDQVRSGLAEMIKHNLIAGKDITPLLVFLPTTDLLVETTPTGAAVFYSAGTWRTSGTIEIIADSLAIKLSIVNKDPEEKGLRKQLNFGHTAGHALESWLLKKQQPALHGICVAAGMIVELHLSEKMAGLDGNYAAEIVRHLKNRFPNIAFVESDMADIIGFMKQDKKNSAGQMQFVLMQQPGIMLIDQLVNEEQIKEALRYYLSVNN